MRLLVSVLGVAFLGILTVGPALADPPPSGPADPKPAPGVSNSTVGPYNPPPAVYNNGCNPMGVGTFAAFPEIPQHIRSGSGPTAYGPGPDSSMQASARIVTKGNTACGHPQVQFQLQSNFCSNRVVYTNCKWRSIKSGAWQTLPTNGELRADLQAPCRSGANTYRTAVQVQHVEADFEETPRGNWVPYLTSKNQEVDSDTIKLDCAKS